jgi:hypothetical protein
VSALPQAGLASTVYGRTGPSDADAAEEFHEASKLYPSFGARQSAGIVRLAARPGLQEVATRAGKRNRHLPALRLPEPEVPDASLAAVLRSRRSARSFGPGAVRSAEVATLLHAAYGVTGRARGRHGGGRP